MVQLDTRDKAAVVAETKGLGIVSTPTGLTLGWVSELFTALPEPSRCQVVLWIEKPADFASVLSLLHNSEKSLNRICIIGKGGINEIY